jgi:hypothetical protein
MIPVTYNTNMNQHNFPNRIPRRDFIKTSAGLAAVAAAAPLAAPFFGSSGKLGSEQWGMIE